jgi:hypothetical protein
MNLRLLDYTITVNVDPIPIRKEIVREEKAHERLAGDYASEKKLSRLTVMQKKEPKIAALTKGTHCRSDQVPAGSSRVDGLFSRYTPETALSRLQISSAESEQLLRGLAVAIGDHMQQALAQVGQYTSQAIGEAMQSAVETRRHYARHRADGDESRRKLRDARLQREHLAVNARQSAAQAAVVGIEYGGGFRHDHLVTST